MPVLAVCIWDSICIFGNNCTICILRSYARMYRCSCRGSICGRISVLAKGHLGWLFSSWSFPTWLLGLNIAAGRQRQNPASFPSLAVSSCSSLVPRIVCRWCLKPLTATCSWLSEVHIRCRRRPAVVNNPCSSFTVAEVFISGISHLMFLGGG